MKTIPLRALKGCPGHPIGEEFMATSTDARALVAIKRAEYVDETLTYKTRALAKAVIEKSGGAKEIIISDAAREFAAEKGIDLATVIGSGQGGRILKSDLQALLNN